MDKYKLKKNKYGFFQVAPTPTEKEISKFYAEEFYSGDYKNFNDSSLYCSIKFILFFYYFYNIVSYSTC